MAHDKNAEPRMLLIEGPGPFSPDFDDRAQYMVTPETYRERYKPQGFVIRSWADGEAHSDAPPVNTEVDTEGNPVAQKGRRGRSGATGSGESTSTPESGTATGGK